MSGDEHPERVNHPEDERYFLAGEESGESPPREVDEEEYGDLPARRRSIETRQALVGA